tara:strand:- start:2680 stop:3117 length:438 start_codon:yes stop_codon:yes gene_type:complete
MAARRTRSKAKPRSRAKPKLNLIDTGVSLAIANAVSTNVTGLNLRNFLFAGTTFSDASRNGYGVSDVNHNQLVTLREIFGGRTGASSIAPIGETLWENTKSNIMPLAVAVIGIPIAAKVAKQVLRKPILTPVNRVLKMSGIGVKV